jgi:biopolymer transport protein ExbD
MIDFSGDGERKPHVNLSALIDVAFILVIFIVLTATFRQERDMAIDLPQTDNTPQHQSEGLQVIIFADGRVHIDGDAVPRDGVLGVLKDKRSAHDSVLLTADRGANVQSAVEIMADARLAGFESVAIATIERQGG